MYNSSWSRSFGYGGLRQGGVRVAQGRNGRAAIGREYRVAQGHEGVRSGEGCPLPSKGGVCEGNCAPSPENFWNFLLEVVYFGEFHACFKVWMPLAWLDIFEVNALYRLINNDLRLILHCYLCLLAFFYDSLPIHSPLVPFRLFLFRFLILSFLFPSLSSHSSPSFLFFCFIIAL